MITKIITVSTYIERWFANKCMFVYSLGENTCETQTKRNARINEEISYKTCNYRTRSLEEMDAISFKHYITSDQSSRSLDCSCTASLFLNEKQSARESVSKASAKHGGGGGGGASCFAAASSPLADLSARSTAEVKREKKRAVNSLRQSYGNGCVTTLA